MKMTPTPSSTVTEPLKGPVLITGASGMLGWDLVRRFRRLLGEDAVIAADRAYLDVTSPKSVVEVLGRHRPTLVVNSAAYTNVDGAETDRDRALAINSTGPKILSDYCGEYGIRFVHFSTDQVFDGTVREPRRETDATHPANFYAESKLRGETAVLENPSALVLRVQWLYGRKKDRFSPLKTKKVFTPFADQIGAPASTEHLSDVVVQLLNKNATGLFHFAYDDYASWADVFAFVRDTWALDVRLEPRRTSEMNLPAQRPLFSVLSNRKLVAFLGLPGMGSWKDPLRNFLKQV